VGSQMGGVLDLNNDKSSRMHTLGNRIPPRAGPRLLSTAWRPDGASDAYGSDSGPRPRPDVRLPSTRKSITVSAATPLCHSTVLPTVRPMDYSLMLILKKTFEVRGVDKRTCLSSNSFQEGSVFLLDSCNEVPTQICPVKIGQRGIWQEDWGGAVLSSSSIGSTLPTATGPPVAVGARGGAPTLVRPTLARPTQPRFSACLTTVLRALP